MKEVPENICQKEKETNTVATFTLKWLSNIL